MSEKNMEQDPGFLTRWSARKRGLDTEKPDVSGEAGLTGAIDDREPDNALSGEVNGVLQSTNDETSTPSPEPLLCDDDMPAVESLTASSDISAFFNRGVSAALRRAALRHVFQQPEYNVRDGLNDYDGDYTVFEPLGDTVTADMKFHAARKERERLEAERLEAERLEAERLEAERLEAERLEAERLEAERLEAERLEAEDQPGSESVEQHAELEANSRGELNESETANELDALELSENQMDEELRESGRNNL